MTYHKYLIIASACILLAACKQTTTSPIRLNQVGYRPMQEKTATIMLDEPITACILNADGDTVWTAQTDVRLTNPVSGKACRMVDFSALNQPGTYTLAIHHTSNIIHHTSYIIHHTSNITHQTFTICNHPYRELTRQALRAYYHQRASMATVEPFAEGYARPAGHPDDHVLVHASAATAERPEGTVISCPGGWYDAGDYNKYIVNSGFTMGVWLMAYEMNRAYFDTLNLNTPPVHSLNVTRPDMLSEAMYNLRWMLTMQDLDGGVYHKLTEPDFEGFIRPDECQKTRYVVMKTTAATLDFAATMALAARVYAPFEDIFPGFVDEATNAAKRAYEWAEAHPAVYYDQPKMNQEFQPAITTGAYDDFDVNDEFYWAEVELNLLTGDERYKTRLGDHARAIADTLAKAGKHYLPATWGNVAELAYIDLLLQGKTDADALLEYLEPYINQAYTVSAFRSPYGNTETDFFWGCNSEGCCWRGVECMVAYHMTGDNKYRVAAEQCLNYILGQNATGYCYVTGFGTKPTEHPHHRLSFTHPKGTLPGFLAGGPNPMQQDALTDGVRYPKDVPADESYLNEQPSYASNEVTINWNATLFALTAPLDALAQ